MIPHIRMGLRTGLLGGAVTSVIAAAADLAAGGGLDTAARVGAVAGVRGAAAAALAILAFLPLLSLGVGLLLACLPLRAAGTASGLLVGAVAGLASAWAMGHGALGADWPWLVGWGIGAGLVTGFLYSRYVRMRLRPPATRPFAR